MPPYLILNHILDKLLKPRMELWVLKGELPRWKRFCSFGFMWKSIKNYEEQKKPEVICMSRSWKNAIWNFLLWRHSGQKCVFSIQTHYKCLQRKSYNFRNKRPILVKLYTQTLKSICKWKFGSIWQHSNIENPVWRHYDP